jgi:hypothetical protein
VETSRDSKVTVLWIQQVKTDRTILNRKPNIIIHDNEKGTCLLTEIVILGNRNVIRKETKKVLTYEFLTVETKRMWNLKMIPVIIRAIGTVSESVRKYLINAPGKNITQLQKTVVLGTVRILRKVQMHSYKMFIVGINITCTIYCNNKIVVTVCTIETCLFQECNCKCFV